MLTYKRKLILTKQQEQRIDSWINTCRFVYNMALEIRIAAWRNKQQSVHKYELMRQLTEIREIYWIKDCSINCLQNAIERLDSAYKKFFTTYKSGGGFPKFRSKKYCKSISFKSIKIEEGKVIVPKLGALKMFKDSSVMGTPKTATIKKEITGYYICITCKDVQRSIQNPDESQVVGIDMGVAHFAVDSNGLFVANPRHFKVYEKQLRIESRSLARKRKGSANWIKQARRLGLLHQKISNVRKDFLHKLSTNTAKQNHTVFLEDLNVKGMVRSNLSKHILDCGWSEFRRQLEYKTNVVSINPKYTSQTCNDCGAKDSKSRISQSQFVCTSCGAVSNADVNAAKNILGKGITYLRERKASA